jgi:hypothetical protein
MADQRGMPGQARVTHVLFSSPHSNAVRLYTGVPIQHVAPLTGLRTMGGTAFMDAVGETIRSESKRIETEGWADTVIFGAMTDGEELNSRIWTAGELRKAVEKKRAQGWHFVLMAAGQNARESARQYGFSEDFAEEFTASEEGFEAGYASISRSYKSIRGASL